METQAFVERPVAMADGFGVWLAEARTKRGLTLEALADVADTSAPTISRIESGIRNASRKMVIRLADALAVDGESDVEREMRRANALFARGFVPDGGTMSQGGPSDEELIRYIHAYDGNDPRLVAARGTVEATDKALSAFKRARDMSEPEEPPADL